jgi:hypothetical protein
MHNIKHHQDLFWFILQSQYETKEPRNFVYSLYLDLVEKRSSIDL